MSDTDRVKLSLGFTDTVDFNSLRIDIGVDTTVRPGEDWQDAIDRVYTELEDKFMEKYRAVKEQSGA